MVSLAKQHERKQGGDTHGGRDWRSKLIPHVPRAETFQAASAGGRAVEYSKLTSQHFPALFAHTLLCTESTRFHLAQLWHHKAQFTFFWRALELHKLTASEKPKGLKIDTEKGTQS